jgi:hypothetical protein
MGADCRSSGEAPPGGGGSSVDAGPDRTVNVGATVTLMGTSTGVATHKWELMSRPTGSAAVIADERSLTGASFVADQAGDYVAKLIGAVSNDPTAPDINPADTDTVTITAVMGGDGGTGGTGGSSTPDIYADAVDDALTEINDDGCLGNCIGDPPDAIGAPDFVPGEGGTVSLGPGGMLGLVFVDELCVVDDDDSTPDIVVYEQGGVQVEDFALRVVLVGETELESGVAESRSSVDQPERRLDLTSVVGPSTVEKVLIIDLDDSGDEPEEPGFEVGWGADIDAVGCFSGR